MSVILTKIGVFAIIIAIGFAAAKLKVVTPAVKDAIGKVILKITMPLLILTSISNLALTGGMLKNGLLVLASAFVLLALLLGLGRLQAIAFRMTGGSGDVQTALSAFGNVIFLGFPLMAAIYPENGLFYAIFFYLASDALVWTAGVWLMGRQSNAGAGWKAGLKHLLNPTMACFALGLILLALGWRLPDVLNEALKLPGSATTPLSLVFIGATLAGTGLKGITRRWQIVPLALVKMILVPAGALLALAALNGALELGMDRASITVVALQTAMPCMTIFAILSKEFGSDHEYAAEAIFVTTLLALATLPGMLWLSERVLGT
jgi:predicted permease